MSDRAIQEAIRQLAGTQLEDKLYMALASVDTVDPKTRTCNCTPIGGVATTPFIGVQLMAEVDDGLLLLPTKGSSVLVAWSTRNNPYVAMFSAIDQVLMVAANGITFQGGELGGIPIVGNLVTQLNNIQQDINKLKGILSAWTPVPQDGGASLKAAATTWFGQQLHVTLNSDIENTSVTHGA